MPHLKRVAILHCEIFSVTPMIQLFAQPFHHYKRWIPSSKFDFELSILKCIANLGMEARSMNCRSMLQAMTGSCGTSLSGSCTGASGLPFVRSRSTSNCSGVSQCFGSPSNTIAAHQSQQTAATTTSSASVRSYFSVMTVCMSSDYRSILLPCDAVTKYCMCYRHAVCPSVHHTLEPCQNGWAW